MSSTNLYNKITKATNIYEAFKKARKGRRYKKVVLNFSFILEKNLNYIYYILKNQKYIHGRYSEFLIKDSKKRIIESVPFLDRVIHHALCNIIENIFDKGFINDSYACRKNKGSHKAIKQLKKWLKSIKDKNHFNNYSNIFYLKCDVSKYFNSVDHTILKKNINIKLKDKNTLRLTNLIIDSYHKDTNKGIPIGNLTSQLFANIYLNELDRFVKHTIHCKYYVRYMDDFVLLNTNKQELWDWYKLIKEFTFDQLKLEVKDKKTVLSSCDKGISYLGYIVFPNKILLRSSTIKRFYKKLKKSIIKVKNLKTKRIIINKKFQNWYSYYHFANYYIFFKRFYTAVIKKHTFELMDPEDPDLF